MYVGMYVGMYVHTMCETPIKQAREFGLRSVITALVEGLYWIVCTYNTIHTYISTDGVVVAVRLSFVKL